MTYRVLLSGGGTAGSVTPLMALVDQLRRQRHDIEFLFIGTADGPEGVLAKAANIPFMTIPSGKLRRYWDIKNLTDLRQIWRGYRQSVDVIKHWRPKVAVTAGSFVSVPVMWAAHRHGVKTLVHQQDVRPGLANRLMIRAADVITVTFRASMAAFPAKKTHWTGNPVRIDMIDGDARRGRELFHLPETGPVLLVFGGGTGSVALNNAIGTLAPRLTEHWSILHVTGPNRNFVELHNARYQSFPFLTWQLPHAMAAADIVVTRAGLGALSELSALGKAAIIVPMPNSHQEDNAEVIAQASAGIVVRQTGRLTEDLEHAIERLRLDPHERRRLGNNLRQFYNPNALTLLTDHVLHLVTL